MEKTDPLLNPLLKAAPGARKWKLRVTGVKPGRITVRQAGQNSGAEEWDIATAEFGWEYTVGDEFELICDAAELNRLKAPRE